jgi:hypothetical protein
MTSTTVKLVCIVDADHKIYTNEDGQLVIEFEREVDNLEPDEDGEVLGELQYNMLWECFGSYIEVL